MGVHMCSVKKISCFEENDPFPLFVLTFPSMGPRHLPRRFAPQRVISSVFQIPAAELRAAKGGPCLQQGYVSSAGLPSAGVPSAGVISSDTSAGMPFVGGASSNST